MSIFSFIKRLAPETNRSNVEDDIKYTKKIFDECVFPIITSAKDCFNLTEERSEIFKDNLDRFYVVTGMKGANFMADFAHLLRNSRNNLDFLESRVKDVIEERNYAEAISVEKAHLLRSIAALGSIADLSVRALNHLLKAEEIRAGSEQEITKGEQDEFADYTRRLYTFLASYGQEPSTFKKSMARVPDAIITPGNENEVAAMFSRDLDPFPGVEVNGFIPHPVRLIREQIANFQIARYESNKSYKKQFELRILSLKASNSGQPSASVEKQILYYENQVAKLRDKIESFEAKYR